LLIGATLITQINQQRQQALTSARLELDLLKRNLQPHFLMNSLMLIIEWIEHQPNAAVKFVESLACELRQLINYSSKTSISLAEETSLCSHHLSVMSYRYDCRFELMIEGDYEQFQQVKIPPAVIHTQIENAFAHNKMNQDTQFILIVSGTEQQVTLELQSNCTRARVDKKKTEHTGTGENYIKARLSELFGDRFEYHSFQQGQLWITRISFKPSKAQ